MLAFPIIDSQVTCSNSSCSRKISNHHPVYDVGAVRVQLADAAIEEQLEVQTAFREHGARLQQIYDKRQRTDMDIARREQEMKQLQGTGPNLAFSSDRRGTVRGFQ